MISRILSVFLLLVTTATAQTASLLLVLEKGDKSLAIVDLAKQQVLARVPAGEDPHEVVVSDDGKFAYISNYGAFANPQHTISVVDIQTHKALPAVDLGTLRAPHGLDIAGGKVYFTAEGSKCIGRYDPATHTVDWTLGVGQDRTHMLFVTRDASRIFTSNVNSGTISVLDRDKSGDASGWIENAIPVGKGPEGFDVSPDGKELWAANSHDGTVSIIDIASKAVTQTVESHTKSVNRLKFTPDGKRVLMSDIGSGDLVVFDAASRSEVKRINLGKGVAGIQVAPDGSAAYVAVSSDSNVAVVDLKTLSVTGRIATGKGPDGMAVVPPKAPQ